MTHLIRATTWPKWVWRLACACGAYGLWCGVQWFWRVLDRVDPRGPRRRKPKWGDSDKVWSDAKWAGVVTLDEYRRRFGHTQNPDPPPLHLRPEPPPPPPLPASYLNGALSVNEVRVREGLPPIERNPRVFKLADDEWATPNWSLSVPANDDTLLLPYEGLSEPVTDLVVHGGVLRYT